jgi:outer membrane biosynthesis protein TonB
MKDGEIHAVSMLGTAMLSAALFFPVLYFTERADATGDRFGEMESIEASIAYKSEKKTQPQKKTKQVEKETPKEGVSHDEKKASPKSCDPPCGSGLVCDKSTLKCKPVPKEVDPLSKFKHKTGDEDDAVGKPTTQPGEFNGEVYGWAPVTKGHPFWQKFAKDIHENFKFPTISDANGIPVGCFHITPDGKIADTKFKDHSESADLDRAAQDALDAVKKLRNESPTPVPDELLGATNRWICVRFDPKNAS